MNIKSKNAVIIPVLLFIVWLVAVFSFGNTNLTYPSFYVSLAFGVFSFIVAMGYLLGFLKSVPTANEVQHIPLIFTIIYLVASLLVNFVFSLFDSKIGIIAFLNILFLCMFVGLNIFSSMHVSDNERKVNIIENRTEVHNLLSKEIGNLLAVTTDSDIKKKLLGLKEFFDYSNAFSTSSTGNIEDVIYSDLKKLEVMISQGTEKEKIIERIEKLIVSVKQRNTIKQI